MPYLVFYSFCASLLHSLRMQLTVSFLSLQNLHLLFCSVLSIFAAIQLFFIVIIIIIIIINLLIIDNCSAQPVVAQGVYANEL